MVCARNCKELPEFRGESERQNKRPASSQRQQNIHNLSHRIVQLLRWDYLWRKEKKSARIQHTYSSATVNSNRLHLPQKLREIMWQSAWRMQRSFRINKQQCIN